MPQRPEVISIRHPLGRDRRFTVWTFLDSHSIEKDAKLDCLTQLLARATQFTDLVPALTLLFEQVSFCVLQSAQMAKALDDFLVYFCRESRIDSYCILCLQCRQLLCHILQVSPQLG